MSAASVTAAASAQILTDTAASVVLANPFWQQLPIAAGTTGLVATSNVVGVDVDTNDSRAVLLYGGELWHALAAPEDEAAYDAARLADQKTLTAPAWWRALAGVFDLQELDSEEADRVGNLIRWGVTARLVLEP